MSKKIDIKIRDFDNLEIQLNQDASAGDYISLLDLGSDNISILFEKYKEQSSSFISKIKEQVIKEYTANLSKQVEVVELISQKEQEYRAKLEAEADKLQKTNLELSKKENELNALNKHLEEVNKSIDTKVKKEVLETEVKLKDQINSLQQEINNSKNEKESLINQHKMQLQNINEQMQTLVENKVLQVKTELQDKVSKALEAERIKLISQGKQEQKEIDQAINQEKVSGLLKQIDDLKTEIAHTKEENTKLTQAKYMRSTKELGEDFEKSIMDSLNENFGFDSHIRFSKTTKSKNSEGKDTNKSDDDATKPDFLIEFLSYESGKENQVIGSIVIEAKDQASELGKQKNSDFYKKLEKDRSKYKADVAFLVTTLEPNENYLVKNVNEYPNILQMRFEAMPQMIKIWQRLFYEKNKLNHLDIALEAKNTLLKKFDEFKEEFSSMNVRLVDETITNMLKQVENLTQATNKLNSLIEEELKGRFKRLVSKFNSFSLLKEIKKSNLSDEEFSSINLIEHTMKEIPNIQDAEIIDEE
ncbi:DUF2130 domain-containing protein [Mycoplasma sp. HF14]